MSAVMALADGGGLTCNAEVLSRLTLHTLHVHEMVKHVQELEVGSGESSLFIAWG